MSEPEATFNASDEVQVKSRKRKGDAQRERDLKDLREVMSTPAGRRFIWHQVLSRTGIHKSSFSTNALSMAYSEGLRSFGLMVEADITEADTNAYLLMQSEALSSANKEAANG